MGVALRIRVCDSDGIYAVYTMAIAVRKSNTDHQPRHRRPTRHLLDARTTPAQRGAQRLPALLGVELEVVVGFEFVLLVLDVVAV